MVKKPKHAKDAPKEKKNGWFQGKRKDDRKGKYRTAWIYFENGKEKTFRWADIHPSNWDERLKYPRPPEQEPDAPAATICKPGKTGQRVCKKTTMNPEEFLALEKQP
jgi:hypothetical protein